MKPFVKFVSRIFRDWTWRDFLWLALCIPILSFFGAMAAAENGESTTVGGMIYFVPFELVVLIGLFLRLPIKSRRFTRW